MPATQQSPQNVLREVFGFDAFRGPQAEIVERVCQGGDSLVLMPTGGGKSLCYQVPALLRTGTALVISPLIALMDDQVGALRQLGVRAACLNSTLDENENRAVWADLQSGQLDLLYLAPERLFAAGTLARLQQSQISLIAVDEAHCLSQWGHDFRPEYLQLQQLGELFPGIPRVALTATADRRTREEIIARLNIPDDGVFVSSFDRPNIHYSVQEKARPKRQLLDFIRSQHPQDAGIVYCLTRKRVEQTAEFLSEQGLTALPYHAGLSAQLRRHTQHRFLHEDGVIVVATLAFGMGIDKPDVRFVAHLDLPRSLEAYYQETGRAGRDGLPASAWMVYGLQDAMLVRRLIQQGDGELSRQQVETNKLDAMLGFCESVECRRRQLLGYFGETLSGQCSGCDNCSQPRERWDATEACQLALSAIWRTGQRFGVTYLTEVLRGASNARIRDNGHDQLSLYGRGSKESQEHWRSVYRQLLAHGLIDVDAEGMGSLRLTERCREVLRGEETLMLSTPSRYASAQRKRRPDDTLDAEGQALFQRLRECRTRLAREQDIPPYMVFSDRSLLEMAERQPTSRLSLADVHGVGANKLDRYGDDFLAVLRGEDDQAAAS